MTQYFLTLAAVDSQRKRAGRAFKHFVNRRIYYLLDKNNGWGGETPNYPSMTSRLTSELNAVVSFLDAKVGSSDAPGPLGGGTDSGALLHIDLGDAAKLFTTDQDGDSAVATRKADYLDKRRTAAEAIIWRAAALHHELWSGSDSATTTTLNQAPMTQVLDRRLRTVERMRIEDDGLAPNSARNWQVSSATSGWTDGFRAVAFEYPFVPVAKDGSDPFSQAIVAAGLSLETIPNFTHNTKLGQLRYNVSFRFPSSAANYWVIQPSDPRKYRVDMQLGGQQPATILDLTVPSQWPLRDYTDFWSRPWMFCDHMAALLHVEALRFGLLRRNNDGDAEFNGAASAGVHLVPLVFATSAGPVAKLMDNGDKYFEAVKLKAGDLQVGDQVIFWNDYFVRAMLRSDFGLENSIVADAADEGDSRSLSLEGHGMPVCTYADFAKQMYDSLNQVFDALRTRIGQAAPNTDWIPIPEFNFELLAWAPFGEKFVASDGTTETQMWWIRVKLKNTALGDLGGNAPLSQADALKVFPHSIAIDTKRETPPPSGLPDHASDWQESIYIPLFVPNGVQGGWDAYLKNSDPETQTLATVTLDEIKADATWIPGLYFKGANGQFPVFRPKVIP
jgi:hypothetical protein